MASFEIQTDSKWVKVSFLMSLILSLSLLPGESRADVPEAQKAEVQHLLDYLKNSGCRMDRNGSIHDADEAIKHIVRKYDYYRDDIKTTEDFIDRSASRSSFSGRAYKVLCPGQEARPTEDWLKEELERYRKPKEES
jgi:uncharacterized protein DUF5329